MGVATDADSRKPVRIHEVAVVLASSSAAMAGRAGITRVWASANDTHASSSTASTSCGCLTRAVSSATGPAVSAEEVVASLIN